MLDAAYAAGVRAFDAARSYGAAEAFLASWLERRGLAPEDVTVSSKWGYAYTAGWRVDAEGTRSRTSRASSSGASGARRARCSATTLRLYQIHSATLESGVLEDAAVREELAALRAGGIRIGLTVTGAGQAATIERALAVGGFDAVQATWNLHERAAERGARARARGGTPASTSRRRSPTAGSPRAARTAPWPPRRASAARPGRDRARRGARPAVGGRRAQRGGDRRAAREQPRGARRSPGTPSSSELLAGLVEQPAAYWAARAELPWT